MPEEEEIDHEYTDNIVCPHCGEEERDSWEYSEDSGSATCGECRLAFHYERETSVTYTTSKS